MTTRRRHSQSGMTLLEIMIAIAIMVAMMTIGWRTISTSSQASREYAGFAERDQELRVALDSVVTDFESMYLSKNEDENATHHRTLFTARKSGKVPEVRFSTLAHRVLWSDAHESEQTQVSYAAMTDKKDPSKTNWIRRETRRLSNENPEDLAADKDILVRDVELVEIQMWDWHDEKWLDEWDTTAADAEKGRLPTRIRVVLTVKTPAGHDYKLTSEARVLLQEPLNFVTTR
jgi:prepilin-type N-terminal cleavage/methylation domain-containing protein